MPAIRPARTRRPPTAERWSSTRCPPRVRLLSRRRLSEHGAVGQPDAGQKAGARAVLGRAEVDGDDVARLQAAPRPAGAEQLPGRPPLDGPIRLATLLVIDRE